MAQHLLSFAGYGMPPSNFDPDSDETAPAAVAGPVAYRVLRKRHDGEWVTDGRAWCDGVPAQDLVDDIALRSEGWRIEYAYAAPTTQAAPVAQGDAEDAERTSHAATGASRRSRNRRDKRASWPDQDEEFHWRLTT